MKIYTKTGDKGLTSLIGGTRVPKHHVRIEAYGTIDELNSYIGMTRVALGEETGKILSEIQDRLFTIGSMLASDPEKSKMKIPDLRESDITLLENQIDIMQNELDELRSFVLPGGNTQSCWCHLSRCVCRRAERLVTHLSETSEVPPLVLIYLNRLSDYLFVLSRKSLKDAGDEEITWKPRM